MIPGQVREAFAALSDLYGARPELADTLRLRWRAGGREAVPVPVEIRVPADALEDALPSLTHSDLGALGEMLADTEPVAEIFFAWCRAATWRRDVQLAPLFRMAANNERFKERVILGVRDRVVEGPLHDALACAPLLGNGHDLGSPDNLEARARLEILIWEAGASAIEVPALGKWIWGDASTFEAMVSVPAHGALRGRVLAARCLEISVGGITPLTDRSLVGRTLQVLQPLLLHPEPLVWVHAARALGRLTGPIDQLEGTILDWVMGQSQVLRQRSMTALASLPANRLTFLLASQLIQILETPGEAAWGLAAMAAATPYLFFERSDLWDRLARRILDGEGGAIASRALARGLTTLWRRGIRTPEVEMPLRLLREMARRARTTSLDEMRRWIEVVAVTDPIDAAERDPLDIELGVENLMRVAAQYDDEEADARAARFAATVGRTFDEAQAIVLGKSRLRQRAAAMNAVEGCARTFALRLWGPLLATRPAIEGVENPDLEGTWKHIAQAPADILSHVKERRHAREADAKDRGDTDEIDLEPELPLEVLAIRLGGYALDACGEDGDLGPGRGPTAHAICLWLRKVEGLADGTRDLPPGLKSALSTLLWRLVDTTRGTALGEVDDVRWLGPFAAWWGLVIDRPAMLQQLANSLPMISQAALTTCCDRAQTLRTAISQSSDESSEGRWLPAATAALTSLHAEDTELAKALEGIGKALETFKNASGPRAELEAMCLELVLAGARLYGALSDPVKALHPASDATADDSLRRSATENAPRVAALIARAIRARELSMLDVWFASLGPVASALVEGAVRAAISRTPAPPPPPKKKEPKVIEGYELVKPLGEGGIGFVWLVRKPGADRLFVLKIPKADALQNATDTERKGILASFIEEANALAGLYHPNVANIIDRGVIEGQVPYLVLEYLIGADLKHYAAAKPMTLFELRSVVLESCAGLAALHSAGLVHRDIKPANLWLRLPLAGGVKFDPDKHRDPAKATPLSTVVIDFGMVRASRVPQDAAGRFVAGTAGYIAPEQVLDPVELDPRSDVYALAGTIYNVTTGRAFFDEIDNQRERIIAHMKRDPFEDSERLAAYPAAIAKLMRAATAMDPKDRPMPLEFGKAFASAI
jgi:eukaryotic-like serine/threonine-protein kinase